MPRIDPFAPLNDCSEIKRRWTNGQVNSKIKEEKSFERNYLCNFRFASQFCSSIFQGESSQHIQCTLNHSVVSILHRSSIVFIPIWNNIKLYPSIVLITNSICIITSKFDLPLKNSLFHNNYYFYVCHYFHQIEQHSNYHS